METRTLGRTVLVLAILLTISIVLLLLNHYAVALYALLFTTGVSLFIIYKFRARLLKIQTDLQITSPDILKHTGEEVMLLRKQSVFSQLILNKLGEQELSPDEIQKAGAFGVAIKNL